MSFQKFFIKGIVSLFVVTAMFSALVWGQQTNVNRTVSLRGSEKALKIAGWNNLYCAGYVQIAPINTDSRIVGAVEEQERFNYSENNHVYLNFGGNKGVRVGDMYSVVRPRGEVSTRWTRKGELGFLVQEVGALQVVSVKPEVSVAAIRSSCDSFLLGDLVQPVETRVSPKFVERAAMNLYADPSGKASGRIFMARDGQEMVTRDQIVYVDLGKDDNVKVGDYLTIYRQLGKGHVFDSTPEGTRPARDRDMQSRVFGGGTFSNLPGRTTGDKADGRVTNANRAKAGRPENLRKVVGELVILNVKEKTATAVVTRTAQEVHVGDRVEVQ